MRNVTIGDLKLYLRELLDNHAGNLRAAQTGRLYERRLRARRAEIDGLPDSRPCRCRVVDRCSTG